MKIVVIGGTGLIGSKVVSKLNAKGHQAVAAAPNTGVNTLTGEGLAEAFAGAEVVVDLANSPTFDEAAIDFFTTAGQNLAATERPRASAITSRCRSSVPKKWRSALISSPRFLRGIGQAAIVGEEVRLSHAYIQPMAAEDVADAVAAAALAGPANGSWRSAGPRPNASGAIFRQRSPRSISG